MTEVLLFRLFGPLASWGEVAVGEVRPTSDRPTRSALLGLMAAALGIDRREDDRHNALGAEVRLAVRVDRPGLPFVDYQTVQWRKPKRKERILTRADELRVPSTMLNTIQTTRHYRSDAYATVAVVARADVAGGTPPGNQLVALRHALEHPHFPLSLGRKACVLALPLTPRIVEADELLSAFTRYDATLAEAERAAKFVLPAWLQCRLNRAAKTDIAWDTDLPLAVDVPPSTVREETRRDQPRSRRRWRFDARTERVAAVDPRVFMPIITTEESSDVPQSSESA